MKQTSAGWESGFARTRLVAAFAVARLIFIAASAGVPSISVAAAGHPAILQVSSASLADGLTVMTITTSLELEEGSWHLEMLSNPKRALIRFRGFQTHPDTRGLSIDDGVVRRVRFGFHPELEPPEIHVVLDLDNDTVRIADLRCAGSSLLIHVVRPDSVEPTGANQSIVLLPTPVPPVPTPSPLPLPSPFPSPKPSPVPSPSPFPSPKPSPVPSPTPVLLPSPTAPAPSPPPTLPAPTLPPEEHSKPTESGPLPRIEEIVITARGDGTTSLRITTDRPLADDSYGCYRMADPPPRQVLSLIGVQETELAGPVPASRSELLRVDVRSTPIHRGSRVDVMFHFASEEVDVRRIAQQGNHLVLLLGSNEEAR